MSERRNDTGMDDTPGTGSGFGFGNGRPGAGWPFSGGLPLPVFNPLRNDAFIKGVMVGAGIAIILGNDKVQRTLIRAATRVWNAVQGEIEEVKERFRDAESEARGSASAASASPPTENG